MNLVNDISGVKSFGLLLSLPWKDQFFNFFFGLCFELGWSNYTSKTTVETFWLTSVGSPKVEVHENHKTSVDIFSSFHEVCRILQIG